MMEPSSAKVAFIGIGTMGWPMASRLVGHVAELAVFDIAQDRVAQFAAEVGGNAKASPAEAAANADILITMLPTSTQVADVLESISGVMPPGSLVVEMSSGTPAATIALEGQLSDIGIRLIDCPVSGGSARAPSGELTIMAGGADEDIGWAEPLLRLLGTTIHRCGPVGSGHAMKALNNLVYAGGFLVALEALVMGKAAGLSPSQMLDVMNQSSGMNYSTKSKIAPAVLSRSFESGFELDLLLKDVRIALGIGEGHDVESAVGSAILEVLTDAAGSLGPGRDVAAVALTLERLSGQSLA
jgi:3-hydroxyisobutyrate dehydrogenase